jgi:tellurite methyltransferase
MAGKSVDFFERQFQRQAREGDYALNPFERAILPHLFGEVLDLGCGLGNLALAAAQSGCKVTALDASPTAVVDLARRAQGLPLTAEQADLRAYTPARQYDCVVSVGLLMFFPCPPARALLGRMRSAVRPGGIAALNVLIEGTTYLDMFDPAGYCLFGRDELSAAFGGWQTLLSHHEDFPAPGEKLKRFHTLVARAA